MLETGIDAWANPYDTNKDALEGRLLPLDDYLNTKKGKQIKDAVPQKIWDSYKINGKQYTVVSPCMIPNRTVYICKFTRLANTESYFNVSSKYLSTLKKSHELINPNTKHGINQTLLFMNFILILF